MFKLDPRHPGRGEGGRRGGVTVVRLAGECQGLSIGVRENRGHPYPTNKYPLKAAARDVTHSVDPRPPPHPSTTPPHPTCDLSLRLWLSLSPVAGVPLLSLCLTLSPPSCRWGWCLAESGPQSACRCSSRRPSLWTWNQARWYWLLK